MAYPTLLDIVKRNGSDAAVGLIDETIKAIPELTFGAARDIKGTSYKTRVRTALPTVGFRSINEGTAATHGKVENRRVEAHLMNPRWEADVAMAEEAEDGAEAYIAEEAVAMTAAAMQTCGSQFYYGLNLDPNKGFPGLIAAVDAAMVVDATGSSANAASSLWAVRWGRQDVQWVWGLGAKFTLSDVLIQRVLDANSNPFDAYCQSMTARPGLQVGSKWSCGRIKNLTAQGGKGLTDALIYTLLTKFPANQPPDMLFTSKRCLEQLRASRTATNATGAPAPRPTEVEGIPIYATESLLDTEAIS